MWSQRGSSGVDNFSPVAHGRDVVGTDRSVRRVCGGSPADTEAIEVKPVAGHILLGLEHDDMDLGSKHTAQDHKATQAD